MGVEQVIDGNVNFGGIAASAGNTIFDLFSILLWVLLIGGLLAVVLWFLSYKHVVVVRIRTKTRKQIITDKARTKVIDGVSYWQLLKMKKLISPPPQEAIEITKKGKFFAECYWEEENPEPIWLRDTDDSQIAFKPFKMDQRALHVAALTKAIARKREGLLQKLSQFAMPVAMVICVAIPFVFYGELSEPQKDIAASNAATTAKIAEITEQNARMVSVLAGKLEAGELDVYQNINPPKPQGVVVDG